MKTFQQFQEGIGKYVIGGALLATPYLMKKFGKKPVDKMIDKGSKNMKIGGQNRMKQIEKAAGAEGFFDK